MASPMRLFALLLILLATTGCGGGPEMYDVSGTVTFDGQPVERGEISLDPDDARLSPDAGVIEQGRFSFPAKPGKKTVRIRASRPLPPERQDAPEMGTLYEDYIPAKYNRQSTLTADISPGGDNQFTFELTTR